MDLSTHGGGRGKGIPQERGIRDQGTIGELAIEGLFSGALLRQHVKGNTYLFVSAIPPHDISHGYLQRPFLTGNASIIK